MKKIWDHHRFGVNRRTPPVETQNFASLQPNGQTIFKPTNKKRKKMRKFKFRGKDSQGTWHYGDLRTATTNGKGVSIYDGECPKCEWDVDPNTVGQFTGMFDKNGREIFEGDIISDINHEVYQVAWLWSGWGLIDLENGEKWGWEYVPGYSKNREHLTVIDNIHYKSAAPRP